MRTKHCRSLQSPGPGRADRQTSAQPGRAGISTCTDRVIRASTVGAAPVSSTIYLGPKGRMVPRLRRSGFSSESISQPFRAGLTFSGRPYRALVPIGGTAVSLLMQTLGPDGYSLSVFLQRRVSATRRFALTLRNWLSLVFPGGSSDENVHRVAACLGSRLLRCASSQFLLRPTASREERFGPRSGTESPAILYRDP